MFLLIIFRGGAYLDKDVCTNKNGSFSFGIIVNLQNTLFDSVLFLLKSKLICLYCYLVALLPFPSQQHKLLEIIFTNFIIN